MAAAAHTPSGYGGVPQKVGKEFNQADTGTNIRKAKHLQKRGKISNKAMDKLESKRDVAMNEYQPGE